MPSLRAETLGWRTELGQFRDNLVTMGGNIGVERLVGTIHDCVGFLHRRPAWRWRVICPVGIIYRLPTDARRWRVRW